MRPRISVKEALLLAECLEHSKGIVDEKLERLAELQQQILRIKLEAMSNPYVIIRDGYTEKRKELSVLQAEADSLTISAELYEALRTKFLILAQGKGKGRYQGKANDAPELLARLK